MANTCCDVCTAATVGNVMRMRLFVNTFLTLLRPTLIARKNISTSVCCWVAVRSTLPKSAILQDLFDLSASNAKYVIYQNNQLREARIEDFRAIADTLKSLNIEVKNLVDGHLFFTLPPHVVRQNCEFLQECGVRCMSGSFNPRSMNLKSVPVSMFKAYLDLDKNMDLIDTWISCLPANLRSPTDRLIKEQHADEPPSVHRVRAVILSTYFAFKYNAVYEEAHSAVDRSVAAEATSIKSFIELLDVLSDLGFSLETILQNTSILSTDVHNLKKLLATHSKLFGTRISSFLTNNPSIMHIDVDTLKENLSILKRFSFPDHIIQANLELLSRNPDQLRKQLSEMSQYPELSVLYHHPKFAKSLNKIDTAIIRLEAMRNVDKRHVSYLVLFSYSDAEFVRVLQHGKAVRLSEEVCLYLGHHTDRSKGDIEKQMKVHPHWQQLNVLNVKLVMDLVTNGKYSKKQIFNGLHLFLYPAQVVGQVLQELPGRPELQPFSKFRKSDNALQIVLYYVEKKYHFNGTGVFDDDDHHHTPTVANKDAAVTVEQTPT